jgi:DNA-binding NarL/FixJ family response regulator
MTQIELLAEPQRPADRAARFELGRGYALHLPRGPRAPGDLYHRGSLIKRVNLRDKAERRLLVVELLQHGVNQTHLAEALKLSRQTLHNYRES